MIQTVRTIIRWNDEDGCILGAIRESEIDLPKWGKRQFLRNEICRFITTLIWDNHTVTNNPNDLGTLHCLRFILIGSSR